MEAPKEVLTKGTTPYQGMALNPDMQQEEEIQEGTNHLTKSTPVKRLRSTESLHT